MSHFNVCVIHDEKDSVLKLLKPYDENHNPEGKYDWYAIGGRWFGFLSTKAGNNVNTAKVKDIDFLPTKEVCDAYSCFWDVIVEKKPLNEGEKELFCFEDEFYFRNVYGNKEKFIEVETAFFTYAVVTPDGVWHEPGQILPFGFSDATEGEMLKWKEEFYNKFISGLDSEMMITIVDCHV